MIQVKFKKLHPSAILPRYAREGDAGMDLHTIDDGEVCEGEGMTTFNTGIALEIPPGYYGEVRGRSSLAQVGTLVAHGTIDSGFRGQIRVVMYSMEGLRRIEVGDRIAQLVIMPVAHVEAVEEELSQSERGTGGFGSSGR